MDVEQMIRVNKQEFHIPVDIEEEECADVVTVENVSKQDIAFKIMTTNPNRYLVRPNIGCIPAGESVQITVRLLELSPRPKLGFSKDRFQLRAMGAPNISATAVDEFWRAHQSRSGLPKIKFSTKFITAQPVTALAWSRCVENNNDVGCTRFVTKVQQLEKHVERLENQIAVIRRQLDGTVNENSQNSNLKENHLTGIHSRCKVCGNV